MDYTTEPHERSREISRKCIAITSLGRPLQNVSTNDKCFNPDRSNSHCLHLFDLTGTLVAGPISKELKKRWSYFIRKVYETDPLTCPKCQGEPAIISFIDQLAAVQKILKQLGLWEEPHAPPDSVAPRDLIFNPAYSQVI